MPRPMPAKVASEPRTMSPVCLFERMDMMGTSWFVGLSTRQSQAPLSSRCRGAVDAYAGSVAADVLRRNNVTVSGNPAGRPMLFAHGFGCDQNMWRFVAPAFEERYQTVLFDYVGAGGS